MNHNEMRAQYEAYPYPERDPADEKKRLITGSPSLPTEMDHHLWGGARDWSKPLRVLVAGGGTGDGLIQLAQMLSDAKRFYQITYLDLSTAARRIAKARAKARGLKDITYLTGSLLDAAEHGPFDYIDCCGVLHHLPTPQDGFDALSAALAPGGGIGLMVYAPLGRSGVYPLQAAYGALFEGLDPNERLTKAKAVFAKLPVGHPFHANPHLVDHNQGDAGFYDLLLHSSDQPFTITALIEALDGAGLALAGVPEPALYDPATILPDGVKVPDQMPLTQRMALAENLRGTFKVHVAYATTKDAAQKPPLGKPNAIPHLRAIDGRRLAQAVAQKGGIRITAGGEKTVLTIPTAAAPLIAMIDGRTPLSAIRERTGLDAIAFGMRWGPVEKALCGYGQMHYSQLLAGRS